MALRIRLSIAVMSAAALPFLLAACSAEDPGGPARAYPGGTATTATSTSTNENTGNTGGPPKQAPPSTRPPPQAEDAGAKTTPTTTPIDASAPPSHAPDAATPPSTTPGSCGNPLCGSTGNECGCTATDGTGAQVQLGCQVGGQCGCFTDQQLQSNTTTDENGACADTTQLKLLFQGCACSP